MSDTLELVKFTAKPVTLEAVQVTEENVETVARWIGSGSYSIERSLKALGNSLSPRVRFHRFRKDRKNQAFSDVGWDSALILHIGDWVMRRPAGIDKEGADYPERFLTFKTKEIEEFVKQQRENDEVDIFAPPYDR